MWYDRFVRLGHKIYNPKFDQNPLRIEVYLDPKKGANEHDYHNHPDHHQPSHLSKIKNIKALIPNKLPCHYDLS